jgi:DNA repair protein SbcC/Rad50
MISKRIFGSPLHEHADPAQRALGASKLPPDSDELARLLAADPAPEVRAAAARCTADLAVLATAWKAETDSTVRTALADALGSALAETPQGEAATALLEADECTDAIRSDVVHRARDADRRRIAIAALRDEASLVEVAIVAEHAATRMAAAQRVRTLEGLRTLADAAKNKDHGVARLARKRLEAIVDRAGREAEADSILAQLEALATTPGPIISAVVELNRRWEALKIDDDAARLARADAARRELQVRFDREQEEQRKRSRFERRLGELSGMHEPPATPEALDCLRTELGALREEAAGYEDVAAHAKLDHGEQRIALWTQELQARVDAEAVVAEAELLAASTSIDDANLPERWRALSRDIRTPALTRRFEAALIVVEQRRLVQIHAAEQVANAVRLEVHGLLHTAEQALAAGHVQTARAAADEIKTRKSNAGPLPKPTLQRLGRLNAQLGELERWESFGQQHARIRLCERAEAAATTTLDAPRLAAEVQKLRDEWKALDQQHAGVPKALWERFDGACERAYAPAARYFAESAAQKREARKRRDEFIAMAAAHAETLLAEPRDWRAIEHWLRETDRTWRDGDLGSVEPRAWKGFDARLRSALAPLRDSLAAARAEAKAERQALIDEATALTGQAMERDVPSRVKELQARWQAQAKKLALAQRDERVLWEQFRAACDAVFDARQARRKQEAGVKHENREALEAICATLEQLATATDKDDNGVRRDLRELDAQWRTRIGGFDPTLRGVESRFRNAKTAVEAALSARARSRESAVWQTLAAKERLCEELDALARTTGNAVEETAVAAVDERWAALPPLPSAWEKKMLARRDGALRAHSEPVTATAYASRIERGIESRREVLLELEIALGLDSPAELQTRRLALQVQQLRQRFQSAATPGAGTPGERLLAWCAEPGIADSSDRERCDRVFSAIEKLR